MQVGVTPVLPKDATYVDLLYSYYPVQVGVTLVLPKDGLTTQWVASAKECRNALASIHLQACDTAYHQGHHDVIRWPRTVIRMSSDDHER